MENRASALCSSTLEKAYFVKEFKQTKFNICRFVFYFLGGSKGKKKLSVLFHLTFFLLFSRQQKGKISSLCSRIPGNVSWTWQPLLSDTVFGIRGDIQTKQTAFYTQTGICWMMVKRFSWLEVINGWRILYTQIVKYRKYCHKNFAKKKVFDIPFPLNWNDSHINWLNSSFTLSPKFSVCLTFFVVVFFWSNLNSLTFVSVKSKMANRKFRKTNRQRF